MTPTGATLALDRLVAWAAAEPAVRGLLLLGSRARTDVPADEWSDIDALIVTTDPGRWLGEAGWVEVLGTPVLNFVEATALGSLHERRVLLDDGTDLDLIPVPVDGIAGILEADLVLAVLARGHRVLLDKDGVLAALADRLREADPAVLSDMTTWPPAVDEVANLTADYWHHCVWLTKRLCRGEVFRAHSCMVVHQRYILVRFAEWQALSRAGGSAQIWFDGRFLEQWAAPDTVAALSGAFPRYTAADVARALVAGMTAFRALAAEVAEAVGAEYPEAADRWVTGWVRERLAEAGYASQLLPE